MSLTAKIPLDKSPCSLYVYAKVTDKIFVEDLGTLMQLEGVALLFYSYSNHRRAYVVSEAEEAAIPLLRGRLPLLKQPVTMIYEARGRKIDLLKFAIYNLERMYGKKIYSFPVSYWILVASLVDSCTSKSSTQRTRRNLKLLTNKYLRRCANEDDK